MGLHYVDHSRWSYLGGACLLLQLVMRRLRLVGGSFAIAKIKPESGDWKRSCLPASLSWLNDVTGKEEDLHEVLNELR